MAILSGVTIGGVQQASADIGGILSAAALGGIEFSSVDLGSQQAPSPAFAITSVTAGPWQAGDTITVNTANAAGALTVAISGLNITADSQSANQFIFTMPSLLTSGSAGSQIKHGDHNVVVGDGTDTDTLSRTIDPPDGYTQDVITSIAVDGLYDAAGISGVENGVDVALGGVTSDNDGSLSAVIDKATGAYSVGDTAFQYSVYVYDDSEARWYGDGPGNDATAPIVISVEAPAVSVPITVIQNIMRMRRAA